MNRLPALVFLTSLMACGNEAPPPGTAAPAAPEAVEEVAAPAEAAAPTIATVGQPAPAFSLPGVDGGTYDLAAQKGKTVVLEWYNPDCPFVKHAHGPEGALQRLGNTWSGEGVVWWAINSGGEGKQGHGLERNRASLTEYGITYPVLLDPSGTVGRLYGAKTTPQMVVIGPDGVVAYAGAIDNAPLGDSGGAPVVNHVHEALTAMAAGEAVAVAKTKPYGCSVKY